MLLCDYVDRDIESSKSSSSEEEDIFLSEQVPVTESLPEESAVHSDNSKGYSSTSYLPQCSMLQCKVPSCTLTSCFSWPSLGSMVQPWTWYPKKEEVWEVSAPTDVVHVTHISYSEEKGFQMPIDVKNPVSNSERSRRIHLVPPKPPLPPPVPQFPSKNPESPKMEEEDNDRLIIPDDAKKVYKLNTARMKSLRSLIGSVHLQPKEKRHFKAEVDQDSQQDLYSLMSSNLSAMRSAVTVDEDFEEEEEDEEWK